MAKKLPEPLRTDVETLVERWGVSIDPELLRLALTHRSWANEAGGLPNNERLEFLGDSVLSIVVADRLFHDHPDVPESDLSRMRAATVSQTPLAGLARRLGLGDFLYLGRGEGNSGGRDKDSILSDTVEALIGATFLTHGFEPTRRAVLDLLESLLEHAEERGHTQDWKTILAEHARDAELGEITYEVEGEGPDHQRVFTAHVSVSSLPDPVGEGTGSSKKVAENMAARAAMLHFVPDFIDS